MPTLAPSSTSASYIYTPAPSPLTPYSGCRSRRLLWRRNLPRQVNFNLTKHRRIGKIIRSCKNMQNRVYQQHRLEYMVCQLGNQGNCLQLLSGLTHLLLETRLCIYGLFVKLLYCFVNNLFFLKNFIRKKACKLKLFWVCKKVNYCSFLLRALKYTRHYIFL